MSVVQNKIFKKIKIIIKLVGSSVLILYHQFEVCVIDVGVFSL